MKTLYIILATILLAIPIAVLAIFNLPRLIVLSVIMLAAVPFYLHGKKSHTTGIDSVVPDAHTLYVPELASPWQMAARKLPPLRGIRQIETRRCRHCRGEAGIA